MKSSKIRSRSKTVYEYQKEVFALLGRAGSALLYFFRLFNDSHLM